ncbi:protein phosphatase 1D [Caerostris darwini]|uniref:Protein phosphatase 1D n=1 Tax=Caerostris darwini TaxID=1538125 RepID=A0AAV4N467_9ARAC|nr:protein phosphatase 1D [Caerostris darwini]
MSTSETNLRVTGQSSQGGRRYMEDAFVVAYQHTEDKKDLEYAFFGIFDGHGGKEAAQYAKNNLLDNIITLKQFWQDDDEMVLSAIRDGFLNTHLAMWKEVDYWPKTASGLPSTAGTTASIAFIRKGKLYTGHVGDSRIVIGLKDQGSEEWQAESLTIDHKPECPREKQRIIDSGGLVMNKSGVERVVWKRPRPGHEGPILRSTDFEKIPFLAVARSLGDLWSYDYFQQEFAVSPEPDLGVMSLDLNKDKCLILASDGLWNIMSPQSAVHLVQDVENENKKLISKFGISENIHLTLCNPSRVLVDCALERWNQLRTRADNVSVITIMLDQSKSSETGVFKDQLILKMDYPRSLPVWDVGLRCKSADNSDDSPGSSGESSLKNLLEAHGLKTKIGYMQLVPRTATSEKRCDFASGSSKVSSSEAGPSCSKDSQEFIEGKEVQNSSQDINNQQYEIDENEPSCSRHTSSPLQSRSNFLPEYCTETSSKGTRKIEAEGIENSPCPFPRWSKSATGRTSLSKLATWSKVVSHRRMSDPFPHVDGATTPIDCSSLSDDENSNLKMSAQRCVNDADLQQMGLESDLCDDIVSIKSLNSTKSVVFDQPNFKVSIDQLSNIKQAIKRKYPDAEISQSFIDTDKSEDSVFQKRKIASSLLKVSNVIPEVQS